MGPDIADFDFRHASLTGLTIERNRAELHFRAAHTHGNFDWWDIIAEFPGAGRVELKATHAESPLMLARVEIPDAKNESVPGQRLLDLSAIDWTGFWLRIRFQEVELAAVKVVETPPWTEDTLPKDVMVLAELTMTSEGGRHGPAFPGYRPDWWIGHFHEDQKALNGAELLIADREFAFPGETVRVALRPTSPEYWTHLTEGAEIEMCEGARICGYARVLEIRGATKTP